jgi:hypothetical protein
VEQPPTPPPKDDPDDEMYVISAAEDAEIPAKWQTGATYDLEAPARCPHCRNPIRSLKIIKLSRSRAPFTSTLPRGGRAIVCPQCECIVSVAIAGMF